MAVADLTDEWHKSQILPPFDRISEEDFLPAFGVAIETAQQRISEIAECPENPTFESVIDKLEDATQVLDRVSDIFFNLTETDSNDQMREIEMEIAPQLARFDTETRMNPELFAKVKELWDKREQLELTEEQDMVLFRHYRSFIKSGANLERQAQERFLEIDERLAKLCTQFGQNILADEAKWHMELSDADLAGLPGFLRTATRQAAIQRGIDGHIVTLDRSLIEPFLKFSDDRALRKEAYLAWASRGDTEQNLGVVSEIIRLRKEMATLLGQSSYSRHRLEDEMAKTPEAVSKALESMWAPARSAAEADQARFQREFAADGHPGRLEPWDWRYYAERRRLSEHGLDEAEIKRYFQLDRLIDAAFYVSGRLFGLSFKESAAPAYHPDCRVWEVSREGRAIGILVGDYFARSSKRSGAWCSTFLGQRKLGSPVRPVVVNACNFIRPAEDEPCLLSFDDARTLFHEFGHALHALLSDVTYPLVSGLSVALDFAELPSQLFENWLESEEVLEKFAVDFESGARLPDDLRNRMAAARNIDQPSATVEYLACAFVDLEFHNSESLDEPMRIQDNVLRKIGMPHAIGMRHATPHFQHVFSGDSYASGYYSYIWADVLAADAYEAFLEQDDVFCPEIAAKLEKFVLSAGGSRDPEQLYVSFRGRLPEPGALLKKRGLIAAE